MQLPPYQYTVPQPEDALEPESHVSDRGACDSEPSAKLPAHETDGQGSEEGRTGSAVDMSVAQMNDHDHDHDHDHDRTAGPSNPNLAFSPAAAVNVSSLPFDCYSDGSAREASEHSWPFAHPGIQQEHLPRPVSRYEDPVFLLDDFGPARNASPSYRYLDDLRDYEAEAEGRARDHHAAACLSSALDQDPRANDLDTGCGIVGGEGGPVILDRLQMTNPLIEAGTGLFVTPDDHHHHHGRDAERGFSSPTSYKAAVGLSALDQGPRANEPETGCGAVGGGQGPVRLAPLQITDLLTEAGTEPYVHPHHHHHHDGRDAKQERSRPMSYLEVIDAMVHRSCCANEPDNSNGTVVRGQSPVTLAPLRTTPDPLTEAGTEPFMLPHYYYPHDDGRDAERGEPSPPARRNVSLPPIADLHDQLHDRWGLRPQYSWTGFLPDVHEDRRLEWREGYDRPVLVRGPTPHMGPPLKPFDDAASEERAWEQWTRVVREREMREARCRRRV